MTSVLSIFRKLTQMALFANAFAKQPSMANKVSEGFGEGPMECPNRTKRRYRTI